RLCKRLSGVVAISARDRLDADRAWLRRSSNWRCLGRRVRLDWRRVRRRDGWCRLRRRDDWCRLHRCCGCATLVAAGRRNRGVDQLPGTLCLVRFRDPLLICLLVTLLLAPARFFTRLLLVKIRHFLMPPMLRIEARLRGLCAGIAVSNCCWRG